MRVEQIVERVQEKGLRVRQQGGQWRAECPCHEDKKASLMIGPGVKGGVVLNCQAGCKTAAILAALSLTWRDIAAPQAERITDGARIVASYRYYDEEQHEIATKVRTADKRFFWRQPNGTTNLKGVTLPLYGLPGLLKSKPGDTILVVEGEKDCLTAVKQGFVATTNPEGASKPEQQQKWQPRYTAWLRDHLADRRFVVVPDNDEAGRAHAAFVVGALAGAGLSARLLELPGLPPKGDLSDWLANGHGPDDLSQLIAADKQGASVASVSSVARRSHIMEPPQELEPEARYGLLGEIVAAIEPHTESHPAAVLASLLVAIGCMMGRGIYVYRDAGRHAGNENVVLVGLSGVSRKGTASRRAYEVLDSVTNSYNSNYTKTIFHVMREPVRKLYGLGSGEALVASLCEEKDEPNADNRRLIVEEEFSRCLKAMGREGSTLSENLRQAWDGGVLASRTKGRRMEAKESHVSVLGHITDVELKQELNHASLFNGFANRFLWFCTRRVRSLPFGGGEPPTARQVVRLREALEIAESRGRMEFDDTAHELWDQGGIYDLLTDRPKGLLGAVTSRAEAHVTRLSLIYALMDGDSEIRTEHLLAALAVWDYSERSAAYIFGASTGDDYADQIEELLREVAPGGLTRTEIRNHYGRHAPAGRIEAGLALLQSEGRAEMKKLQTPGRAAEMWLAKDAATSDRSDGSDKSPLKRAREWVASHK